MHRTPNASRLLLRKEFGEAFGVLRIPQLSVAPLNFGSVTPPRRAAEVF
jgi:hypothetical protein